MINWEYCMSLMSEKGFDNISDPEISKLQEGDLILTRTDTEGPLKHAGIYCGNQEVIGFTSLSDSRWSFLPHQSATVSKAHVNNVIKGKPFFIHRLKSGIPEDFRDNVSKAMDSTETYDLLKNNCLHFSLKLLKLQAEPLPERDSVSNTEGKKRFSFSWGKESKVDEKNEEELKPLGQVV